MCTCVSVCICVSIIILNKLQLRTVMAGKEMDIPESAPLCTLFFFRPTRNAYTLTVLSALILSSMESSRMKVRCVHVHVYHCLCVLCVYGEVC